MNFLRVSASTSRSTSTSSQSLKFRSTMYVGGRTPNAFENNPVDVLGGIKIYPRRWFGFGLAYRQTPESAGRRITSIRLTSISVYSRSPTLTFWSWPRGCSGTSVPVTGWLPGGSCSRKIQMASLRSSGLDVETREYLHHRQISTCRRRCCCVVGLNYAAVSAGTSLGLVYSKLKLKCS